MKRLCKYIDITDVKFIRSCIDECLSTKRQNGDARKDVENLLRDYHDLDVLAQELSQEIKNKKLRLKPIWYSDRLEPGSGKIRHIAIQDIKQQIYDYIAVNAMESLWKRIGLFQCSSIKGRGPLYCKRAAEKGVRKYKYFYKADVHHYFQSLHPDVILDYLGKRIKNDDILWLVKTLLDTFDEGLAIGSYLSQNLANLIMSVLYHELYENCFVIRRKRSGENERINCVGRAVFYMDDFVIFADSKKHIKKIHRTVLTVLASFRLKLKRYPTIARTDTTPVDMAGYRIWKTHTTVRKRNFLKMMRAINRFKKRPKSIKLARRIMSFWGFFIHADVAKVREKIRKLVNRARKVVSDYDKNKSKYSPTGCAVQGT